MKLFIPLLPDGRRADLLRAMLLDGDAARESWRRWRSGARDVRRELARDAAPLLAVLHDSVRRNDLETDSGTTTYLRSAFLTESLRSRTYHEIVDELTAALEGVPFLLIKGAAVGRLWYPAPELRHAHDVEIVADAIEPIREALAGSRFRQSTGGFVHISGLPVRVHVRLPIPVRAPLTLDGGVRTLDATDALALALVHASRWISRASLQWICDFHFITRRASIDWPRFHAAVHDAHATRRVNRQLAWVRTALEPEVRRAFRPPIIGGG